MMISIWLIIKYLKSIDDVENVFLDAFTSNFDYKYLFIV